MIGLTYWRLMLVLVFSTYSYSSMSANTTEVERESPSISAKDKDKEVIQQLIRRVIKWADEESSLIYLPTLEEDTTGFHSGLDLNKHKRNLKELEAANFFAKEFLDNYDKIYLTIDKKLKDKELEWSVGETPPFGEDADPWCWCQDTPYDNPNPKELIEIEVISLDKKKGELHWKWGGLGPDIFQGWRDFRYKFRVVKENGEWKIAYLQGFDFDRFTVKNY